jgi:hypothetical protein
MEASCTYEMAFASVSAFQVAVLHVRDGHVTDHASSVAVHVTFYVDDASCRHCTMFECIVGYALT